MEMLTEELQHTQSTDHTMHVPQSSSCVCMYMLYFPPYLRPALACAITEWSSWQTTSPPSAWSGKGCTVNWTAAHNVSGYSGPTRASLQVEKFHIKHEIDRIPGFELNARCASPTFKFNSL